MDRAGLDEFCRDQRPQLVGGVGSYCGDTDVAEEVAQEALARATERWDDVHKMDAPGAWVYRVAVNLTNSRFRRRSTEQRVMERLATSAAQGLDQQDPVERVALQRALESLPAQQRAAVALRYLLDWSVADVAGALGVSPSAVTSLTHRGIANLRSYFEETEAADRATRPRRSGVVGVVILLLAAVGLASVQELTSSPVSGIEVVSGSGAADPTGPAGALTDEAAAVFVLEGFNEGEMVLTEGTYKELEASGRFEAVFSNGSGSKVVLLGPAATLGGPGGEFTVMVELGTELLKSNADNRRFLATDGECDVNIEVVSATRVTGSLECGYITGMRGTFLTSVDGPFRAHADES